MQILALDLGKGKTVACDFEAATGEWEFETVATSPRALHDLIAARAPDRVVLEIGALAGWVCDLVRALGIEVQVANPNHEAWRWKSVKRKTDRDDALKLARLSSMNQLPLVHMPGPGVRAWRQLIRARHSLVGRRTESKNAIRAILTREGIEHPPEQRGWTKKAIAALRRMAEQRDGQTWRVMLSAELAVLAVLEEQIRMLERELEAFEARDERVSLLRTIPGVGARVAEAVVALIDDPRRFRSGRQVGAYLGLTPRLIESGSMSRSGRITGRGDALLRGLLVEAAWVGRRYNPWMKAIYERVCGGNPKRKKIAIVAVARRLLVRCWAMLRDGTKWREGPALRLAA